MITARRAVRVWRFGNDPALVAAALDRGAVVALPTESSYGLGVDPRDAAAVERIFDLKGRGSERALPVVGAGIEQLVALGVDAEDPALRWAAERWPAPLTIVVALAELIPAASADGTLAVRVPAHEGLRRLLASLGRPLTATSANPSGEPPYVDADAVATWLGSRGVDALVVDGGRLPGGLPSSLVAWRDGAPRVLRPGRYPIA